MEGSIVVYCLQFPLKACQTGARIEKVKKNARRESRRWLDEHHK